ncbi:MAG: PspA/IM30 family protein [Candidatus Sumerlaeaceae bacterium]
MKLIQRVTTLLRADIDDLLERADDPETMINQLVVDMNNQLIQVKTAAAQCMADEYGLEKRLQQARQDADAAQRRLQFERDKGDDELAGAALQRCNGYQRTIDEMQRQLEEQRKECEALKLALGKLDVKVSEVNRQKGVLLARHKRAAAKEKLTRARSEVHPDRLEELLEAIGASTAAVAPGVVTSEKRRSGSRKRRIAKSKK